MRGVTDPNAMNEAWQTPLMVAAFDSNLSLMKDLIERKANVNAASRFGVTPLMYASGLPEVKLLLEAGASAKDKNLSGRTALHYAAQRGADLEVVRVLIEAGADVNAKDDKGMTALQFATLRLEWSDTLEPQDVREAYRQRIQKVVDLLAVSGKSARQ